MLCNVVRRTRCVANIPLCSCLCIPFSCRGDITLRNSSALFIHSAQGILSRGIATMSSLSVPVEAPDVILRKAKAFFKSFAHLVLCSGRTLVSFLSAVIKCLNIIL